MFSCLGKLGCLLVAALIAAAAWFGRDAWYPQLRERLGATPAVERTDAKWQPLSNEGAERGRVAFEKLRQKDGPVFVNLSAGDFASFLLDSVVRGFSQGATGAAALARGDRLYLRAHVSIADLGGPSTLGPLSGVLEGRQELTVRGRTEVLRPGRAQFRIDEVKLKDLPLPTAVIAKILSRVWSANRDASTAGDAIPLRVPPELADVRVSNGRMTLYKNVP